jgi:hypothetical protein
MDRVIRHEDGRMISSMEYSAIKTSARMIRYELRRLPVPHERRLKGIQRRTKTYYRSFHPNEWKEAIRKLEELQPLLALCTSNWKADHVLGNALLAATDDSDVDRDSDSSAPPPKKHSSTSKQARKKKKEKAKMRAREERGNREGGVASNVDDGVKSSPPSSFQLMKATATDASDVRMGSLSPTSSKVSGMKRPQLPSSPQKQNAAKKKRQDESATTSNPMPVVYQALTNLLNFDGTGAATPAPKPHGFNFIQVDACCKNAQPLIQPY